MSCDPVVGRVLASLGASKPGGQLLELGTGVGEGTSWIAAGMQADAALTTVDIESAYQRVAQRALHDDRVTYVNADGAAWLTSYRGTPFDFIFADACPGKFDHLSEALDLVAIGGMYVIDDLNRQSEWPERHAVAVERLMDAVEHRSDFRTCRLLEVGSGMLIACRHNR